jgi:hypothetical protein
MAAGTEHAEVCWSSERINIFLFISACSLCLQFVFLLSHLLPSATHQHDACTEDANVREVTSRTMRASLNVVDNSEEEDENKQRERQHLRQRSTTSPQSRPPLSATAAIAANILDDSAKKQQQQQVTAITKAALRRSLASEKELKVENAQLQQELLDLAIRASNSMANTTIYDLVQTFNYVFDSEEDDGDFQNPALNLYQRIMALEECDLMYEVAFSDKHGRTVLHIGAFSLSFTLFVLLRLTL